jgi:hypothetical protein
VKAITVHNFWAWAIWAGHKRYENRQRRTSYRGPLAIHAGVSSKSLEESAAFLHQLGLVAPLDWHRNTAGSISAVAELIDVHEYSKTAKPLIRSPLDADPWAWGPIVLELANIRPIVPRYCRGALDLWDVPPEIEATFKFTESSPVPPRAAPATPQRSLPLT